MAVELKDVERNLRSDSQQFFFIRVHKHADLQKCSRDGFGDLVRAKRRDVARALRIEIKSQGICAGIYSNTRIFLIRDAADLDDEGQVRGGCHEL